MDNGKPNVVVKKVVTTSDFSLMNGEGHPRLVAYGQTQEGADTVTQCNETVTLEICKRCDARSYCKSSMSRER
jgi:hypothetical protein